MSREEDIYYQQALPKGWMQPTQQQSDGVMLDFGATRKGKSDLPKE